MCSLDDQQLVFGALDNALEGGYDLDKWTVEETVQDLVDCWYYAEKLDRADLVLCVRAWRAEHGFGD